MKGGDMRSFFKTHGQVDWRDRRTGGSTIEYGFVALLIAIVIIGVVTALDTPARDESLPPDQPVDEEVLTD